MSVMKCLLMFHALFGHKGKDSKLIRFHRQLTVLSIIPELNGIWEFSSAGQTEEPPHTLSSPTVDAPLDSPLSCADLTLDSTGDLTMEDVRDFLT